MSRLRPGSLGVTWLFLFAGFALANTALADELRTWTDVAGRKTEARFVRVFNGEVILEKDNRALKVPLSRFSTADQEYIRQQAGGGAPPAAVVYKADDTQTSSLPANKGGDSPKDDTKAKAAADELRQMRAWRDSAGNTIQARFERFFGNRVVLMRANRPQTIDFPRLSAADQEFLRRNFEAQGKGAEVPAVVAATQGPAGTASTNQLSSPQNGASGNPPPNMPGFGDFANAMRQQQERATHEQMRAKIEQMRDEMKAARERMPRPTLPRTPPPSAPVVAASPSPAPPAAAATSPFQTPPSAASGAADDPFRASAPVNRAQRPTAGRPSGQDSFSPPAGIQPSDPFAQAPAIGPQYEAVIVCGNCNTQQNPGFKVGQRCRKCGRTIDEIEDESGEVVERSSRSTRRNIKFWVWAVIVGIGLIGSAIAKLRGS